MTAVHHTADWAEAKRRVGPLLTADPVANNVCLSLLDAMIRRPTPGSAWWTDDGTDLGAIVLQTEPRQAPAVVARDLDAIPVLVEAITGTTDLPGINGEIRAAARFAGAWATVRKTPARAAFIQRYYVLDQLVPAPPTEGGLRNATVDDMTTLEAWSLGFQRDVFGETDNADTDDLFAHIRWKLDQGEVWLWETDRLVSMTMATRPVGGVSRIQGVYTPTEERGNGWAGACVSAVVEQRLARHDVERCVLFTDLANPTSNAIYQRLGFEPSAEHLNVVFGAPS